MHGMVTSSSQILDSLSVHSKMSLIHSIVTHILKQVSSSLLYKQDLSVKA